MHSKWIFCAAVHSFYKQNLQQHLFFYCKKIYVYHSQCIDFPIDWSCHIDKIITFGLHHLEPSITNTWFQFNLDNHNVNCIK